MRLSCTLSGLPLLLLLLLPVDSVPVVAKQSHRRALIQGQGAGGNPPMPANTKQPPASWAAVDSKKGTGGGIDSPWSAPKSKPKSWLSKLMGGKDKSTKDQTSKDQSTAKDVCCSAMVSNSMLQTQIFS